MTIPGSPGKTFGKAAETFGGGFTVWDGIKPIVRYPKGATFVDALADKSVVLSGTPVKFNRSAETVTICKAFRVHADVGAGLVIPITKAGDVPRVSVGDYLMVAPATPGAQGQSSEVASIDTTNEDYDEITLDTTSLAPLTEGDVLVIAATLSATAVEAVVPTDFILNNIYVGDGDNNSQSQVPVITDVVFEGSVMEERMPPFPPYMKSADVAGQRYMFNPE